MGEKFACFYQSLWPLHRFWAAASHLLSGQSAASFVIIYESGLPE